MILLHLCLQIITPFTIYFNARFIYQRWELWRLFTNFMFFGSLGVHCEPINALCNAQQLPSGASPAFPMVGLA